jgi:hypothetical protein
VDTNFEAFLKKLLKETFKQIVIGDCFCPRLRQQKQRGPFFFSGGAKISFANPPPMYIAKQGGGADGENYKKCVGHAILPRRDGL